MHQDDLSRHQAQYREHQAHHRKLAVQAITEKNRLYKLIAKSEKHRHGSQEEEQVLLDLCRQYAESGEQIERVKAMIRIEEERIRQKTAEAIKLKTEWKQQQLFAPSPGPPSNDTSHFMTALVSALLFMVAITGLLFWLHG
jgi:hypothetical protein